MSEPSQKSLEDAFALLDLPQPLNGQTPHECGCSECKKAIGVALALDKARQEGRDEAAQNLDRAVTYHEGQMKRMADSRPHQERHEYAANILEREAKSLRAPPSPSQP